MLPFARMMKYGNELPERTRIKKIQSGVLHIALLYDNGELYTRGEGSLGRLGTGNSTANYTSWTLVQQDVKDVWCGAACTLVLKNDNTFLHVGQNNIFGTTGSTFLWTDRTSFFTSIGSVDNNKKIELGSNGIMVLTRDNSLYVAGRNLAGELGSGNTSAITALTLRDTNVQDINYSNEFSTYTKENILYRSGYGNWSQRGDGSTSNLLTYTALPSPPDTLLEEVSVSTRDIYYIYKNSTTNIRSLYVNGHNTEGELGTGNNNIIGIRTNIPSLDGKIMSVQGKFGYYHKTVVLDDGVYASGINTGGQCGVGSTATRCTTFTKCVGLPVGTPQYMIPFNTYGTFIAINDLIYWCGIGTYFTGVAENQLSFTKLETPYN